MSHYDCRECGAAPLEECDCRKLAASNRALVMSLGIVLDLAEPAATQALHFAYRRD